MFSIALYPTLSQIQQRLFGVPDGLLQRLAESDPTVPQAIQQAALANPDVQQRVHLLQQTAAEPVLELPSELPAPPAFIQALIGQKVAAHRADFGRAPQRGQLVRLASVPTPAVALLAGYDDDSQVWHGWWVSPDVQYAGFWDFLLQAEDAPFDPACGVVQLWNPTQLHLTAETDVYAVGRLSEARMQAVEALALEYLLGDPQMPRSRPGLCALRAIGDGFSVVTGTPLGQDDDPRYAYQQVYHQWAAVLNEPAQAWQRASQPEPDWLAALNDRVAAAWRKLTGISPQALPVVAFAMGEETGETGENVQLLSLQEDLQLTLSQLGGQIAVCLSYGGETPLTVTLVDGGEFALRTVLQAGTRPLEYSGLRFYGDNRLRIEWPDGRVVELPLTLT